MLGTVCAICEENVVLTPEEKTLLQYGHSIGIKICDKCKQAILRMRKQIDNNSSSSQYNLEIMKRKNCRNCKHGETCASNYCDAVWEQAYNIRDGKDCWEPNLISMKDLKNRNVFEKDGRIEVAISDVCSGYIWITNPEYYNEAGIYGYTSAALLQVKNVNVRLIEKDACCL